MTDGVNTLDSDDDAAAEAVAERLGARVTQELPCAPGSKAAAEWVARWIETGFTRAFAVNTANCVGPQCVPVVLAELERRGAEAGDREFVVHALVDFGPRDPLRCGPLAPVLANALYAPVDTVLQEITAAAREGGTAHARCVRLGHEVVVLFDHSAKLNWLFSGAKYKVRDALAKVGCDARVALTQDVDLAQGGKLSLPGYVVIVTRRWGRLQAHIHCQEMESPRAPVASARRQGEPPEPKSEVVRRPWRWHALGFVGRAVRAAGAPIRALQSVDVSPRTLARLPASLLGYVRAHSAGAAIGTCMVVAFACLAIVATDVHGNLSGETVAPRRPPGFYVGQYNKASLWGKDLRPYGLYFPPHFRDRPGPFPLIVYLHGYGERSPRQLFAAGLPLSIATRFGEGTKNGSFEFVALFLNDPSGYWEPNSPEGRDAMEVLDYVVTRHQIDPKRVYLTGVSSGGAGVWQYAEAYPDRWAAVAPLGAIYTPNPFTVQHIPAWIFHGERDETAPIERQRALVRQLKEVGCDVRFTEFPGKAHTVSSETYDGRSIFEWFASKTR